ncbi:MAG: protein O-GlcNAcase [Sulfolobales archaeon]
MFVGIVEGFYGSQWDFLDRISMISFMGRIGLNLYMYAPKDDPYHRIMWRSPYPMHILDQFGRLVDLCQRHGVSFGFAISPGLDIEYSSQEDLRILIRKLDLIMNLGVRIIGLFLDDIPPELRGRGFKTLAEAQANLTNKIYRELSPEKLIFVPTFYWGYEEKYLRELGELLERDIDLVWTGRYVASPEISLEDVEKFREITGRYPAIWDNYPVNDFFTVRGVVRLHMGFFKGRNPEILRRVSVFMANPMNQAEASKIPIYTLSRLAKGYTPQDKDLYKAAEYIVNEEVLEPFKLFIKLNLSSILDLDADLEPGPEHARAILDAVDSLRKKLNNKKLLEEIRPVLELLDLLARRLGENSIIERISGRIQSAGLYYPPISDESMKRVFGVIARRKPKWVKKIDLEGF